MGWLGVSHLPRTGRLAPQCDIQEDELECRVVNVARAQVTTGPDASARQQACYFWGRSGGVAARLIMPLGKCLVSCYELVVLRTRSSLFDLPSGNHPGPLS